jgi:hypothetical protein
MYHVAHTIAVTEYLVTRYFFPGFKQHAYVSQVGEWASAFLPHPMSESGC